MNKTILSIVAVVLVFGALVWFAQPDDRDTVASVSATYNNSLAVEEGSTYDFGTISMAAGTVSHLFKLKNRDTEPVTIHKIYTSCMCTTAALSVGGKQFGPYGMPGHQAIPIIDHIINPDEEATIEVVFDPAAPGPAGVGRIERSVTIENNAGQPVLLQVAATVRP